ncbi:tetratricopeptide repeat protein [Candidatus Poribacteria bacterium]|nr:tetratricopeptide repeat protein [Candidatus Poribacteria bacterium]
MNLEQEQNFVYAWRYEGDETACKIGKSSVGSFWGRTGPARTTHYRDIEILGIQLCDSEAHANSQEKNLLGNFKRVRPDREWVYLNNEVWNWIKTYCMKNTPQLIDFDKNANYRVGEKGEERKKTEKARQRKNRAKEKLDAGEYEDALERFTGVIELRPNWADAYLYRGIARFNLDGANDFVLRDFDKAIELNPDLAEAYLYHGYFKEHKSQYGNAIADFDKAIQLKPDLVTAYIARGDVKHMYLEQHEDAITDYDVAIGLTPDDSSIYYQRGKAKIEMAQYQAAISDIDRFIGSNPNSAQPYFYRGVAKFNLNYRKEAKQDFHTAWQLTPENAILLRKKIDSYLS